MSKARDFIAVFIIQLILTLPFYTANVYGLSISNVRVAKVASNSATIEWSTDNISNGRVKYGKTTALGFTERHDNFIDNHSVSVFNGIDGNTAYFFAVESTDLAGNTAMDNNSNNFYTFKTTDIIPPQQVTGLKAVSATFNSIYISWDNLNITDLRNYVVYRNRVSIANTTKNNYNDTSLTAASEFTYKVSAVDNSSNEGPQSDALIASTLSVDSSSPIISNIDVLPITDATAKVTWLTNENATTTVLYGVNKTDKLKSSDELTTNHSIVIDGLTKDIVFFLNAKSCDKSNNCANVSSSFLAVRDVTPPSINLSVPRFINRRVIDIVGSVEPFSKITFFVNDLNIPKRILSSEETGKTGKFAFSQIQLQQDNTIKIVAIDKSGNRNEKTFEVSIDTDDPTVQLNEVPSLTPSSTVNLSGSVNEPVAIKVFVDANVNESSAPSKIAGLNATTGQNSVELKWDESKDKDFSHYVIYRDDIAIAITKPANFNLFIDALVDSGKGYTYKVSAVNIFGKEGQKSEPLTVTTLKGGATLNLKYPEVDIFEDFRKPLLLVNASNIFNFPIKLSKGDGIYKIKLMFEDKADNSVTFERTATLNTKRPSIKITSPPSGALIFENVANQVDIIGKTEPNSRVHLFVDRTPFSFFNLTFEINFLRNEIQDLPDSELDAKCRFNVAAKSFCRTGADFSVDADKEGSFKFEKVDLNVMFGGAGRIREVPVTELRDTTLNPEAESRTVKLVVIATDKLGRKEIERRDVRLGTCFSGNQSWDVIPVTPHQSPTLLSTERLREGTETLYFFLNYSYIGRGQNAKITAISLGKACGERSLLDSRFNISCQLIPPGNSPVTLNQEKTLSYSAVTLSRLPGMDKFLEDDWKGFFKAINKELTFPFKIHITYEHEVPDESGQYNKVKEVQTTCEQLSYDVDDTIIDFRKVLPDWMLFNAVDFLQDRIKDITKVQEQIGKVLDYVAVGCLVSFFTHLAWRVYRIWLGFADEKLFRLKSAQFLQFKFESAEQNEECKKIANAVREGYGSLKLKYFSDADLKKCFPSSYSAWQTEAKWYQLQRWSCDRVFGHATPSAWTESEDDEDLHRAITSYQTCASDGGEKAQPLRAEDCKDIAGKYSQIFNGKEQPFDKKCFQIQTDPKSADYYVYTLDDRQDSALAANNIYRLTRYEQRPTAAVIYVKKLAENRYITAQPKSCEQVCGIESPEKASKINIDGKGYKMEIGKKGQPIVLKESEKKEGPTRIAGCVTRNQCREWYAKRDEKEGGIKIGDKVLTGYSVTSQGYTSDCFYEEGDSPEVLSDTNPNLREVCCCVNGKTTGFKDVYYQFDDVDKRLPAEFQKPVHESKSRTNEAPSGFADMQWSYRYWREQYLGKKYNPNRYIEGRDLPACFGQDLLHYKIIDKEREVLAIDPFKQDVATLQCLYLTGINQRLQMLKNIMNAMSNCLIQVRTTGRADTGVCKELFTQHVCGLIWQGIRLFIDGCTPEDLALNVPDKEDDVAEIVRRGFKSVTQGISESAREFTEEYGNAKLNDLLGTGEETIARKLCLLAFGYDWDITARNLIDAAYSAPFATLVQAVTRSREFLTVDPQTLEAQYEYRASWLINPGCDLERYDIKLVCVSRKELDRYPNQISCGSIGAPSVAYTGGLGTSTAYNQCDCLELPQEVEESTPFFSESRLKQNSLIERNNHKVVKANRRYDHIKFVLRTDRKVPPNSRPKCFPDGYEEGVFYFPLIDKTAKDIADCTAQPASGLFTCSGGVAFFNRKGTARLLEVTINGENADKRERIELSVGSPLVIGAKVLKTGRDKCLRITVQPDGVSAIDGIPLNGTNEIPPITVSDSLRIAERRGEIRVQDISHTLIAQNNQEVVTISVKAFDNGNKAYDGFDDISIDGVKIELDRDGELTSQDGKTKIKVKDRVIRIEKEGAVIDIKDIVYRQTRALTYEHQSTITINQPKQVTQTSQQKTILVEVFNIKDDRSTFNNQDDCNLNDKVLEKKYTLAVSEKSAEAKTSLPTIQLKKINPTKVGQSVTISAVITHASGIKKAELVIEDPDGTEAANIDDVKRDGNNFEYIFDTTGKRLGKYKGKLKAISRSDLESTTPFEFELIEK